MRVRIQPTKYVCFTLAWFLVLSQSGCATLFKGERETVFFSSNPSAAKVFIDNHYQGETPLHLELPSKNHYRIEMKKEGYKTRPLKIDYSIGPIWLVLDILGGLIPLVVDASTEAWYQLAQTNVSIILQKQENTLTPPEWLLGTWVGKYDRITVTLHNIVYENLRDNTRTDFSEQEQFQDEAKPDSYVAHYNNFYTFKFELSSADAISFSQPQTLNLGGGQRISIATAAVNLHREK